MRKIGLERRTEHKSRPKTLKMTNKRAREGHNGPGYLTRTCMRSEGGVRALLLENRATIQSKPSPPGDVDTITSERGEDNTILLMGELTSEREGV